MEITRIFDILDRYKNGYENSTVLNVKENKVWKSYSTNDFIESANLVAYSLMHLGLTRQDKVAIISQNRPEWNFVDFGSQLAGIATAPIYPTISANDLKFILNHSEAKIAFISDKSIYTKLQAMEQELPHLKFVFSFNTIEGVKSFAEFLILGSSNAQPEKLQQIKASIKPEDLLSILYTSGTTGTPKGVMLSHKNLVSNIIACEHFAPFKREWKALSFLPLNHIYERMVSTLYFYHGMSVYYAESFETIGDNCREIKPQIFVAVPRIIERVYERITSAGEKLTGFKRKLFDWSVDLAHRYQENNNSAWFNLQRKIADKLIYKKWREAVGGEMVCIASGGAALNSKLERVFTCAGLNMLQGYGLTETSPVISVNRYGKDNVRFGCVGPICSNIEVKIAEEDGEILMRGPSLMMGYYKNPEATAEVIDADGWFHTGDVGTFVENKFLKITDRKKEIFKTSSGKYIAPIAIENKLKECKFIDQCMVVGEGQKFASAIIVPSFANFKEWCKHNNQAFDNTLEISQHEELKKIINTHIKEINKTLAPYEQLKRCEIVNKEWSIEGGEITPKLSLKRKVIIERYMDVINKIFSIEA
jgi:long-chain acyl-CoA synthetase